MVWAPSIVSCACNKNEVKKKNNTNSIPFGGPWNINTSLPIEIYYSNYELIDTVTMVDTKTIPKDEPDCRNCIYGVHTIFASNPPQDGGFSCSILGKKNPTKDECPGITKYV